MRTAAERYDEAIEALRDRVFVGNEMAMAMRQLGIAMIEAAVARERARCAAWVGTPSLSISEIIALIERGDEP